MHMHSKNERLTGERAKQLSDAYKALSHEDWMQYQELGKRATELHRVEAPSFPTYSRRAKHSRGEFTLEGASATSAFSSASAELDQQVCAGRSCHLPCVPESQDDQSAKKTMQTLFRKVVSEQEGILRRDRARETLAKKAEQARLLENSAGIATMLLEKRKGLSEFPALKWYGVPHASLKILSSSLDAEALPSPKDQAAQTVISGLDAPLTAGALADAWAKRHTLQPKRMWKSAISKKPYRRCHASSFCACRNNRAKGRFLTTMYNRVCAFLKSFTNTGDSNLEFKLLNAFLILEWCGESMPTSETSASSTENAPSQPPSCKFTHVGLQYKKPWATTLVQVHMLEDAHLDALLQVRQAASDQNSNQAVHLDEWIGFAASSNSGAPDVVSLWEWVDRLSLDLRWSLRVWELSERQSLCPVLRGHVCARLLSTSSSLTCLIWNPTEKNLRRQPKPTRQVHEIFAQLDRMSSGGPQQSTSNLPPSTVCTDEAEAAGSGSDSAQDDMDSEVGSGKQWP